MRKVYNTFLTMTGTAVILYGVKYLNKEYYNEPNHYTFLNVTIQPEYYSGFFGLMFLTFICIYTLRYIRLKAQFTTAVTKGDSNDSEKLIYLFRYSNWLLSPFHGRIGIIHHITPLAIAIIYSFWLAIAHIKGTPSPNLGFPEKLYNDIGYFLLLVATLSLMSLGYALHVIMIINRKLENNTNIKLTNTVKIEKHS